jgi:hypothetical protein
MDINVEWITSRRYLSEQGAISSADTGAEIKLNQYGTLLSMSKWKCQEILFHSFKRFFN